MTTEREMLEFAAKACELKYKLGENGAILEIFEDGHAEWNPLTNSADCAAMCAKLDINTFFYLSLPKVECSAEDAGEEQVIRHIQGHNGTNVSKESAWRHAATVVAAKIGGMK